jgi:GNAT superfamily N-acetyltransferase
MATTTTNNDEIQIGFVENTDDLVQAFDCQIATFGRQTEDSIWRSSNPGWDTPEGRDVGIKHAINRWNSVTRDHNGNPNTIFLKATVPDEASPGGRKLVGYAIWVQHSAVPGHGEPVPNEAQRLEASRVIHPHNETEARFLSQMCVSLYKRRAEVAQEKAATDQPAFLVLDCCIVDPSYQGRGIARQLVQWGLEEAERRGGLEATTEGSVMGRRVYTKLGFQAEPAGEVVYVVDQEFSARSKPGNIFLRTRVPLN